MEQNTDPNHLFFVHVKALTDSPEILELVKQKQASEEKDEIYDPSVNLVKEIATIGTKLVSNSNPPEMKDLLACEGAVLDCISPQFEVMEHLMQTKDTTLDLEETIRMLVVCCRIIGSKRRIQAFHPFIRQNLILCMMHRRLSIGQVIDALQKICALRKELETHGYF